jgi:DNA polymerase III alpha subunit
MTPEISKHGSETSKHGSIQTCQYHEEFVKSVVATNESQNQAIARVEKVVNQINDALIGTLDKQGLIGRVASERDKMLRDIDDLMEWKSKMQGALQTVTVKLIGVGGAAIIGGAVVAVAAVKWMVG